MECGIILMINDDIFSLHNEVEFLEGHIKKSVRAFLIQDDAVDFIIKHRAYAYKYLIIHRVSSSNFDAFFKFLKPSDIALINLIGLVNKPFLFTHELFKLLPFKLSITCSQLQPNDVNKILESPFFLNTV